MPKLPVISGKKLLKALLKAGFVVNRRSSKIVPVGSKRNLTTRIEKF